MKRKKISKPPAKNQETPSIDEDAFLVGLMKKHDISYDQALKMAIQMDAEKDILNVSRINLLLKLKGLDDLNLAHMVSGRSGGSNGGYIGRNPALDDQEKYHRKMVELKEKELQMKAEHYRRMEDRQMVFDYHEGKEKKKKNNKKPNPKAKLKESYELWAKENLTPNTKKSLFRDDIERDWLDSDEYEKWYDLIEEHGLDEPAESQRVKVYSAIHTELEINIHRGNLPLDKKRY